MALNFRRAARPHPAVILVALLSVACAPQPTAPSAPELPPPVANAGCSLGPFVERSGPNGIGCPATVRGCPMPEPPGGVAVFGVRTCTFAGTATGCEPKVFEGLCHSEVQVFHMLIADPNAPRSSPCGADFQAQIHSVGGVPEFN